MSYLTNPYHIKRSGKKIADTKESERLLALSRKYIDEREVINIPKDEVPLTPSSLFSKSGITLSDSPIHNHQMELFNFYNSVFNSFELTELSPTQSVLTAQAGLESLSIAPISNYQEWYDSIAGLLDEAIYTEYETGEVYNVAKWHAHQISLPLHKYIMQVPNAKRVQVKSYKNREPLMELCNNLNDYLGVWRKELTEDQINHICGTANELTILASLGSGALANQNLIALPSYEWEDSSETKFAHDSTAELKGFDIRLHNFRTSEVTKLQVKSSANQAKKYQEDIIIIRSSEITMELYEKTGIRVDQLWKLAILPIDGNKKSQVLDFVHGYILRKKAEHDQKQAIKRGADPRFKGLLKFS